MDNVDTRIVAMLPHLTVEQKEDILRRMREMAMYESNKNGPDDLPMLTKCKQGLDDGNRCLL